MASSPYRIYGGPTRPAARPSSTQSYQTHTPPSSSASSSSSSSSFPRDENDFTINQPVRVKRLHHAGGWKDGIVVERLVRADGISYLVQQYDQVAGLMVGEFSPLLNEIIAVDQPSRVLDDGKIFNEPLVSPSLQRYSDNASISPFTNPFYVPAPVQINHTFEANELCYVEFGDYTPKQVTRWGQGTVRRRVYSGNGMVYTVQISPLLLPCEFDVHEHSGRILPYSEECEQMLREAGFDPSCLD